MMPPMSTLAGVAAALTLGVVIGMAMAKK